MRGIAIITLFALTLWLFAVNLLFLTPITAAGVYLLIKGDKGGHSVDGVFVGCFVGLIVVGVLLVLKHILGAL